MSNGASNYLAILKQGVDEEQYRAFTKEMESDRTEITNEDLLRAEREKVNRELFESMGFESVEDMANYYKDDIVQFTKEAKKVEPIVELEVEEDDPYHIKKYEAEQAVFIRRKIEDVKEGKKGNISYSNSTDTIIDDKSKFNGYGNSNSYEKSKTSSPFDNRGGYGQNNSSRSNNPSAPKEGEKNKSINDDIGYIFSRVQETATQRVPGWNEKREVDGWASKPSFKRKTLNFLRSKKAKILSKTALLMSLQLGMAVVGKKYEFQGMGQMVTFLGMMMGVFYLTRELVEDGFDPRGFGIL